MKLIHKKLDILEKYKSRYKWNEMKFKNDRIKYDNKWQKNMPF